MTVDDQTAALKLDRPPAALWPFVERAAEQWGAELERDGDRARLWLPVRAGLRSGIAEVELLAVAQEDGCRLTLEAIATEWHVQWAAVVVLLAAAVGGLTTVAWPFFPALVPLAPFGAILALSAWFLVITRLRSSRAEDFLDSVELLAAAERPAR